MENGSLFRLQHAIPKYSKGPMTAHQKNLPKLPLPSLIRSMEKYLTAVKPLLTTEEYQTTENIVQKFCAKDGDGVRLYSVLEEQYRNLDNWIEDRWIEEVYLKQRDPISPIYSPSTYILKGNFESQEQILRFTSSFIYAIVDFKTMIDRHQVKPDMLRGNLMDMSQYFLLFSTTRIPYEKCDNFVHFHSSKHIVIAYRNKFFQVNVFDEDGTPITIEQIFKQLQIIVSHTKESVPVGVMTTQHRDIWVEVYQRLCEVEENRQTVKTIESALFIVCLDKEVTDLIHPDNAIRNLHNFVHGCGPSINGGNRWFDCGIQIIITEDGILGINSGSTPLEAQSYERMIIHSLNKAITMKKQEYENGVASPSVIQQPKELYFHLSSRLLKDIEMAKVNYQRACDDVDMEILKFNNFGRKFLKAHNISLDSFVQMAYQLTFYKLHGNNGVVCSVATLHQFYQGQYDLLHSTTTESLEFCKTMLDDASTDLKKFVSLRKALQKHKYLINEALNGNGINNLLLGLRRAAEENNVELPNIFKDKAYLNYLNIRVISSQVSGIDVLPIYVAYGPFVEDGYGCPYYVYPDKLHFCVFSLKHNPETNSKSFLRCLETSLLKMKNIIIKFSEKTDNKPVIKNHERIPMLIKESATI